MGWRITRDASDAIVIEVASGNEIEANGIYDDKVSTDGTTYEEFCSQTNEPEWCQFIQEDTIAYTDGVTPWTFYFETSTETPVEQILSNDELVSFPTPTGET